MNNLNSESSLRLSLLRFPLIVGVVFIHAYETTVGFASGIVGVSHNNFVTEFTRNLISQGFAQIAVPMFFLLSGYFLCSGFTWSIIGYWFKVKSRIKSLLIPFLFWNIATLCFLALIQFLPATQEFLSGKQALIANFTSIDYLNAVFGIGRFPISYQFWFIRDLMLLVLLVPIIGYLNKVAALPFLLILFLVWVFGGWPFYAPSSTATLFFSTGCYLGYVGRDLFALDRYGRVAVVLYIFAAILAALALQFAHSDYFYVLKFCIVFGLLAALYATKLVVNRPIITNRLLSLGQASFFVFAAHEPLLTIGRKLAYKLIQPDSTFWVLLIYFMVPTIVIVILVVAYRILSTHFTRFTRIITGGR